MIAPGTWTDKSLRHQAKHLADAVVFNNGFICASPKVCIVAEGWEHKDKFLGYLQEELKKRPSKPGYYKVKNFNFGKFNFLFLIPLSRFLQGAHFRHQTFINKYKDQAILIRPDNFEDDHLEWVLLPNVKPAPGEYAFVTESFSPLLAVMELEGGKDTLSFLDKVAPFCNERLWGSLSCTLLIPDEEVAAHSKQLDECIDKLGYGTVGVNIWASISYGRGVWGAFPGTGKPEDIQSGVDYVFNPYNIENLSKTVARAPLVGDAQGVKDLGRSQLKVMSRLARYSVSPSTWLFSKVVSGAISGL